MIRFLGLITAIAASSAGLAAPMTATATLEAPTAVARLVANERPWHCNGTTCSGAAGSSRFELIGACAGVADRAGRVSAFTAGATTFDADALAKCNRHLKDRR